MTTRPSNRVCLVYAVLLIVVAIMFPYAVRVAIPVAIMVLVGHYLYTHCMSPSEGVGLDIRTIDQVLKEQR